MTPAEMQAFRAERRNGIGASDAWDCCFNPLKVYLDKTGQLPEESSDEMSMGLMLEPVIAALYERATGQVMRTPRGHYERAGMPWMRANPDGVVWRDGLPVKPVDLKAMGDAAGWGPAGTDEVPEKILLQVQQQIACCDADEGDVAALIRLADFRVYTIRRHQGIIDRLAEIEGDLWGKIQRREPPAPDWSHPDTPRLVELLHRPSGPPIELGAQWEKPLALYLELGQNIAALEKHRERVKAEIVEAMGSACKAVLPDGRTISRKVVEVAAQQRAAYSFTNFTVSKPKRSDKK